MNLRLIKNPTLLIERVRWEVIRGVRLSFIKYGIFGWMLFFCTLAISFLLLQKSHASQTVHDLQQRQNESQNSSSVNLTQPNSEDGRIRLQEFQQLLLPYDDIPNAIQDMLQLASQQDLTIVRGDYKPQADIQGNFLRYQMVLPVTGDIQSINKYIQNVLIAQKTLALQSIKFKRERANVGQIEARIQWVLFTRLPPNIQSNHDNIKQY